MGHPNRQPKEMTMTKLFIATIAVAATLVAALGSAEAQQARRNSGNSSNASSSSAERERANSRDPSGNYRGYPDWARSAFSPRGTTGGGGR